jgi:hypothetical protein
MLGRGEKYEQNFGVETWRGETTLETRRRWEDNIKIDLNEIACGYTDRFHLSQDRDQLRGCSEDAHERSGSMKGRGNFSVK